MTRRLRRVPSIEQIRSAVSNGSRLMIDGLDHRSAWARRLRDLMQDGLAALGPQEAICEFERVLVRRSSMLTLQAELLEQEWARSADGRGSPASLDLYQRIVNSTRRTFEVLAAGQARPGFDPEMARDVTSRARSVLEEVRNGDR